MRRNKNVNNINELTASDISAVWADPVLRYSNILEGIFHEKVIVCEADGDCRFYNAIADALREPKNHAYIRDIMFAQSGGKGGVSKLVRALKKLAVPVTAVVDFDVLRDAGQLWSIVEALGGDPSLCKDDYAVVKKSIDDLGSVPPDRIKAEIAEIFAKIPADSKGLSQADTRKIHKLLKTSVGWERAKSAGLNLLGKGNPRICGERLFAKFREFGLEVVPSGELEAFCPLEASSKNEWVNEVLDKCRGKLGTEESLAEARKFVTRLIEAPP